MKITWALQVPLQIQVVRFFLSSPSFQKEKERGANEVNHFQQISAWPLRKKRLLEKAASDPLQTRITDYWNILDDIQKLVSENRLLSSLLQ